MAPVVDGRDVRMERVDAVAEHAKSLAGAVQYEHANLRFYHTLTVYVPDVVERVRTNIRADPAGTNRAVTREIDDLTMVVDEIGTLVRQRRHPTSLAELGDVDAVADACYRPIVAFAKAEGLGLTTGWPAAQFSDLDLAIWTGFIPTSIAPIFLPREFFKRAAWWPAVAHEIGHDFIASVAGLNDGLRHELGITDEQTGTQPLSIRSEGMSIGEVRRLFGAWFEEIFCDVFATLMCGPAYLASMLQLFSAEYDVREIFLVGLSQDGTRYDVHPPRHLRFLIGRMVLDRVGLHTDAQQLLTEWEQKHAFDNQTGDRILLPTYGATVALPLSVFEQISEEIVEKLYRGPLPPLAGHGLSQITGLDYGPHEHANVLRARDSLAEGKLPAVRDLRAVVSGTVLAARELPEMEAQILTNARAAIPALGTHEHRPDAYHQTEVAAFSTTAFSMDDGLQGNEIFEAIIMHEIMNPPRSVRRAGRRGL